ncbi:MAG: hypothetical protein OXH85_05695 [Truepera sp.]|nr:hypothetical protein [Truepera sp.]
MADGCNATAATRRIAFRTRRQDMLGNLGHAAPLSVRIYGMRRCPQRTPELLGELVTEALDADMLR